jgi:hypothetical protein
MYATKLYSVPDKSTFRNHISKSQELYYIYFMIVCFNNIIEYIFNTSNIHNETELIYRNYIKRFNYNTHSLININYNIHSINEEWTTKIYNINNSLKFLPSINKISISFYNSYQYMDFIKHIFNIDKKYKHMNWNIKLPEKYNIDIIDKIEAKHIDNFYKINDINLPQTKDNEQIHYQIGIINFNLCQNTEYIDYESDVLDMISFIQNKPSSFLSKKFITSLDEPAYDIHINKIKNTISKHIEGKIKIK